MASLSGSNYSRYLRCSYEFIEKLWFEILNFLIWNVVIGMTSLFQSFKRHRKEVWRQDVSTHVILHHHFRPKVGREKRIRCRNLRHERALLLCQCFTMLKTSQITYKADSISIQFLCIFAILKCYLFFYTYYMIWLRLEKGWLWFRLASPHGSLKKTMHIHYLRKRQHARNTIS